ncbi:hypothetical protein OAV88_01060 [bacterium]|nr:hypothetical protein [bacterium]
MIDVNIHTHTHTALFRAALATKSLDDMCIYIETRTVSSLSHHSINNVCS